MSLSRRRFLRTTSGAGGLVLLGGGVSGLLAACSGPQAPAAPAASGGQAAAAQAATGQISFLTPPWGVTDPAQLQTWQNQSKITVQSTAVPNEQVYQKVQLAVASNTAPADVIFESEDAPSREVALGAMAPLDEYIAKESATFNADKITNFGEPDFKDASGKIVGITAYIQNPMLDYNAKKLSAAGFDQPPTTWDEFMKMAQAIKDKGVEPYPIAFAAIYWSWFLIAMPMGDPMFDQNGAPTFNGASAGGRRAMSLLVEMFDRQLCTPDLLNAVDPHSTFESGIGTFHQSWLGAHAVMNNPSISKQAPDVRYALLPEQHFIYLGDSAIGLSNKASNPAAGWEFIKFYMGPENQRHLFDAFGLVPSLKSVVDQINAEGKNQQADVQAEQVKYLRPLPRTSKWWGSWTSTANETIKRAVQHQLTADAAVDQLADEWNKLKSGG
jgi:multiple sugar transport system substrate-binding protein